MRLRSSTLCLALFFFFSLNCVVSTLYAQENKSVYTELLGNGFIIASVNYDQRLSNATDGVGFRIGVSVADVGSGSFNFPVMINYLIGEDKHQLELGAGMLLLTKLISFNSGDDLSGVAYTGSVMYRLNFNSGLVFRIGYTPVIDKSSYPVWFGSSLGFRF